MFALCCVIGLSGRAAAHGGLPVSNDVIFRGQRLYVPTQYWGVFVRVEDGTWRWICDEAINGFKLRDVRLGGDGTFYATDITGLSLSRDEGCTWQAAPGEISERDVAALLPDPATPARVWVTTVDPQSAQATLWRSDDAARSWVRGPDLPGQGQRGIAVSPDGKRVYLTGLSAGTPPAPVLHMSKDGGARFSTQVVTPSPPALPSVPAGVDPRAPHVVYLIYLGDMSQALWRADTEAGTFTEVLRLPRPIFGVTVDQARDRLLIATGDGVYYADGAKAPVLAPGLSRSQCTAVHDGEVYACSWNYYPDLAAVARSPDGTSGFSKVFQYADTRGLLSCPAQSGVSQICPAQWPLAAASLGIEEMPEPEPMPMDDGCSSCQIGGRRPSGRPWRPALLALGLGLISALRLRRRARAAAGSGGARSCAAPAAARSR